MSGADPPPDRWAALADPGGLPAGASFKPNPQRTAQGWEFRFVAGGPRLKEALKLYRELGFEVLAEPVPAESFPDECEGCQLVALLALRTIYTRRPPPARELG